jgi:hypothetical protein
MRLRRAAGSLIVRPGLDWIPRRQPSSNGPPRPVGALGQTPAIMLYRNVSAYFTRRLVARLACATLHGQKAPTNRSRISAWDRKDAMPPDRLGQFTALCRAMLPPLAWPPVAAATQLRLELGPSTAHTVRTAPVDARGENTIAIRSVGVVACGLRPGVWESLRQAALPAWASRTLQRARGVPQMLGGTLHGPIPAGPNWLDWIPTSPSSQTQCRRPGETAAKYPRHVCQAGGNRRSPCFEWPQGGKTAWTFPKTWNTLVDE